MPAIFLRMLAEREAIMDWIKAIPRVIKPISICSQRHDTRNLSQTLQLTVMRSRSPRNR